MTSKEKSNHYYLVCGTLMLVTESENISSVSLNAVLPNDTKELTVAALAKAQQALQANLHQRMGEDMPKVVDIVLASFSYLGFMTASKFNQAPEGMMLSEKADTPLSTNDPFAQTD